MAAPSQAPLIGALDIGSSKVSALICTTDGDGRLRVLGTGQRESRGVKRGFITDMEASETSKGGKVMVTKPVNLGLLSKKLPRPGICLSLSTLKIPRTIALMMMTQKMVKPQVTMLTPKPRTTSTVNEVFMRRSQSRSLTSGAKRTLTTI